MKTLDVEHIFTEFEKTLTDVSKVAEQISSVESAIKSFHNTDESFKGKMADSMRAYYYDCHLPFLEFLQKSLEDVKAKLKQMKEVIQEFEPHSQGYINEDFLSGELKSGFDKARDVTVQLTEETNDILRGVRDIIDLSPIDDSLFIDSIEKGKTKVDKIVERLHEVDKQGQKILEGTREDLDAMMKYLSDLVGKVKNGSIVIENYSMLSAINLDGYQALIEKVHGENVFYGAEIEAIMEKVNIDEDENGNIVNISSVPLSDREKDLLYEYIQNIYLTDDQKKHFESIPGLMNEQNIDELKNYLNDNVVISQENLANELMLLEMYLYTGSNNLREAHLEDPNIKRNLITYSLLLNDYIGAIGKNEIINISKLEYKSDYAEKTSYHVSSSLEKAVFSPSHQKIMSEGEFRDFMFESENMIATHNHGTEITYYGTGKGSEFFNQTLNEETKKERANYSKNYWINWAADTASSAVATAYKLSIPLKVLSTGVDYYKGREKLDDNITIEEAMEVGLDIRLEVGVSSVKSTDGKDEKNLLSFYPSEETYKLLDRWKEISVNNPDVKYPTESIATEDWNTVVSELDKILVSNEEIYKDIFFGDD
ncbi:T7SS effector LXG polymorphic toxin [Oceanobacillus kimchii]|uniref:T7SS effector LXG polymorphic toxin n=1 Tax=Oceanobacillus kimchii TaxID=746691 RepID=UPI003C74014B